MHVLSVFGTRPEAIKVAPVIRELDRCGIAQTICVTGQHRELLDQVNSLFGIVPDIDLDLMEPGQTPTAVASRVLRDLEPVLSDIRPDWLVVQGDTTTVVAAALAAAYAGIPVAHLEAGLRTGDRSQPFPEEINRVATTSLSTLHLAPTTRARNALLREGVADEAIVLTGNTVIDALLWAREQSQSLSDESVLHRLDPSRRLVLLTAHRRENFGAPLDEALHAVAEIAKQREDSLQFLFPVHPNPNVRRSVTNILGELSNVVLCEPLSYLELVAALDASWLVLTDSGGIQEEAPALGKPVLVLRDATERPEAVSAGAARLVGTNRDLIISATCELLDDAEAYRRMSPGSSPFGDGIAAERAVKALTGQPVEQFRPRL